jgi:hypothetical protein
MIQRWKQKRGFAIMEYFVLLVILIGALFSFRDYFLRAITGKWKSAGDQFGYGRQFHPTDTVECSFDSVYTNQWYDSTCFDNKNCPQGNSDCERKAIVECQSSSSSSFCTNN